MIDQDTYGFNKADASALLRHVGGSQLEFQEGVVRGQRGSGDTALFVTGGSGIAARSGSTLGSATCTMLTVAGGTRATTSTTATVYNDFLTSIGASVDIAAAKVDGIWLVIAEDCT